MWLSRGWKSWTTLLGKKINCISQMSAWVPTQYGEKKMQSRVGEILEMTINCLFTLLTLIKSWNVVAKGWYTYVTPYTTKRCSRKKIKKSGFFINTKARNQLKKEKKKIFPLHVWRNILCINYICAWFLVLMAPMCGRGMFEITTRIKIREKTRIRSRN